MLRHATGAYEELRSTGMPLGVAEGAGYDQGEPITLQSGDVVVIGTDGIWESSSPAGEMFGKERMREVITASARHSADEIRAAIADAVNAFSATQPQNDDIIVVVIKTLQRDPHK